MERPASALNDVNLNFRLIGTAVVENSGKSLAVIEHGNTGEQVACWEGGSLGQVIIKKILWNRVIIDTGNGEMVLSMGPGGKLGEGKARIPETSRRAGNVNASAYPARLNRKELAKAFPDYTSLLQTVKIKTHFQAGSPEGILLDHIEPGCLFSKMGLQDGDVIKEINGERLVASPDAVKIYSRLKHGGRINLSIQRGGEIIRLRLYVG